MVKQFTCEHCGIGYYHREGLSRHLQSVHSDPLDWPYKCEVCGMGYEKTNAIFFPSTFQHHPNTCICFPIEFFNRFKIKNGLYNHRKKHTDFQHKCKKCGKAFRKRVSLRRHLEYHTGTIVKPFVCDFCGKSFRLNINLVEHRRIHTGEKPFACEYCSTTFRTMSSFYSHLRKVHGTLKLAICLEF